MSAKKKPQRKPRPIRKVTWAEAFRDIVIASMNRGQLPILAFFAVLMMILWRMPSADVSKLAFDVVDRMARLELWAYLLLFVVLVAWYMHARFMRKSATQEYRRIGREKSKLQSMVAGVGFSSSEG